MKLEERSYSSKVVRPKPLVHVEEDGSLIVVATAWGQPEHAVRALEEVVKYVNAAKADVEVTSPFEFLSCLSDEVNYVRTGMFIANEVLYRGENRNQYFSGVEIMALFRRGSQIAWAHMGAPSLLIQRQGKALQPLSMGLDLSSELRQGQEVLPPLPAQLLGIDSSCDVHCGHVHVGPADRLVLLSSAQVSQSLWSSQDLNLAVVTQKMIQEEPDAPFWLGIVSL